MFPSDYNIASFDERQIEHFARKHLQSHSTTLIARLAVTSNATVAKSFATYLRLNGQTPALYASIEPGIDRPPVIFSWYVAPRSPTAEHRYRLYPVEGEWTSWSSDSEIAYYYIGAG